MEVGRILHGTQEELPNLRNYTSLLNIVFLNMCHGFVSAGDALGRERLATPMSSFLAGGSGCK